MGSQGKVRKFLIIAKKSGKKCPNSALHQKFICRVANGKNDLNCPDKLKNASECTKLNIDFQNFLGGDTPEPPFWREGERICLL